MAVDYSSHDSRFDPDLLCQFQLKSNVRSVVKLKHSVIELGILDSPIRMKAVIIVHFFPGNSFVYRKTQKHNTTGL